MRSWARALAPLLALSLAATGCVVTSAPPPVATGAIAPAGAPGALAADHIQILHTNDIHGHLDATETVRGGTSGSFSQGGLVALAQQIEKLRARAPERTLLVDAGDAWQGTYISNENKGQAVTQVMSLLKYDAQAVGNHDFDWGQDVLRQRSQEAAFPLLCANCVDRTGAVPAYLKPYVVKDLGIVKVAMIGLILPGAASIIKDTSISGLHFLPLAETVRAYLPEMKQKADLLVAVTHVGIEPLVPQGDRALAAAVPDLDVIVGGHSHTALRAATTVGKTIIVQTGAYNANLGDLELVVDPATKKISGSPTRSNELQPVASSSSAKSALVQQIQTIVDERIAAGKKYTERIVGRLAGPLDNPREECGLGNMIADGLLEYGRQQNWKSDVAFYNMAGVRARLPAGDITYGQLYQVLPFTNVVMNVDLTGAQLRSVFEAASGSAGRLHVGGATFTYKFTNPAGRRLVSATVGGQPIDDARAYHVATIDYLYGGGDGHTEFKEGTNVIYGDIEVDTVSAYMTAHSPLDPKVEGRIVMR
ncbi:MAG TPA: bifunctional UDP-sugar hydrolase/5'-nucleotidase [Candidatus Limnocylindria bacterium]|nr:bifunctional UDP-sugar hydrolase/5'-nucleotidase [Candidatus Limnocylindria bacterium]